MNRAYFTCILVDGTEITFQNLCTCVKEFTEDMIGFYADSHGTSLLLQIIPKVQIRRIINHYTESSLEKIKKLWEEEYGEE